MARFSLISSFTHGTPFASRDKQIRTISALPNQTGLRLEESAEPPRRFMVHGDQQPRPHPQQTASASDTLPAEHQQLLGSPCPRSRTVVTGL
eukprot:176680-Rhodomonas_salina.1